MSELPENLLNELHRKESICAELEALTQAKNIDYQSEISRLTEAYEKTGTIPPEYAELLDKRFAHARKAAIAGEVQYLATQEKIAQLAGKTEDLIAAARSRCVIWMMKLKCWKNRFVNWFPIHRFWKNFCR